MAADIRSQWHVLADGDVIQSSWSGDDPTSVTHGRFATTGPVDIARLVELQHTSERHLAAGDRRSGLGMVSIGVGVAGVLVAWLVLDSTPAVTVAVVAGVLVVLGLGVVLTTPARMFRKVVEAHEAAGLDYASQSIVPRDEAARLIEAPGTVHGPAHGAEPAH